MSLVSSNLINVVTTLITVELHGSNLRKKAAQLNVKSVTSNASETPSTIVELGEGVTNGKWAWPHNFRSHLHALR